MPCYAQTAAGGVCRPVGVGLHPHPWHLLCLNLHLHPHPHLCLYVLQDQKIDSASGDANFEALAKYGTDLTANAARLDPVIGRDEEIRRVVRILSRCGGVGAGRRAVLPAATKQQG